MIERLHLEILQSLHKEGSLTKAAEKLSLTQPALTHSIKKLEGILGCKLWTKRGRILKLTKYGEFILKRSNKILPQFQEMELTLNALISGKKGNLNICIECHPCYELIIGKIDGYLKKWQDVELNLTRNFQFNGVEAILNRSIDVIISPDKYEHSKLIYYPILDFELLLAVPKTHSLANVKYADPQDILSEKIYSYPVSIDRLDIFTKFLIPANVKPKNHTTVEDTEIIIQLVSSNRGISYFPDWIIDKYSKIYDIKGVKMLKKGIFKTLYVGVRKEDTDIEYIQDFIKCVLT
ncbi:MAG: LysR family transcriptional regulator [Spirochaetales bacterium]|nr:LysR family transcriptional regulator [Spirochaetales bacterium]